MRFVIIGIPGHRRIELFQAALTGLHLPPAQVISYADLIAGQVKLAEVVRANDVVRIESSGQDWEVERAILQLGAQQIDEEATALHPPHGRAALSLAELNHLAFDQGRIWPQRQWYLGYRAVLADIERQLLDCPPHRLMNHPSDIATLFDKRACHRHCLAHQIPVPPALPPIHSYAELMATLQDRGWQSVFIKPAHGSSASGVLAYQFSNSERNKHRAVTTVEWVMNQGHVCLYNSLRPRRLHSQAEIAALIDLLCQQRVHVERWIPKAGIDGHAFDLRVLVIDGQAKHTVVRMSRNPMTNLHLGNARGNLERVRSRMSEAAWHAALHTCERVAASFPRSLYVAIDLLITTDFKRHLVLEANAFGDLLPRLLFDGQDTYASEIGAMMTPSGDSIATPE